MKKNTVMTWAVAAAVLACAGCDQTAFHEEAATDFDLAVGIVPTTEMNHSESASAQVGKQNFETGDVILLTSTGTTSKSQTYTVGETLQWSAFAEKGEKVRFAGCYPAPSAVTGTFEFDMAAAENKDLLLAPAVEAQHGDAEVRLQFRHAMHQLRVVYKSEGDSYTQDQLNGASLVIAKAKSRCAVDLGKGELAGEPTGEMTYGALVGSSVSALLVPQNLKGLELQVTIDGEASVCTFPANNDIKLEGGKCLTLTISCRRTEKDPEFTIVTSQIEGWGDQGAIDGELEL